MEDQYKEDSVNILIIDDVTINLIVLTEILEEAGYSARPVTNVYQAKQAVRVLTPHLILMDVSMPEINGYEYCQALKKDIKTRDIPIIFISALTSVTDRVRGFECGAEDFIMKPFEKQELLSRVRIHLKSYHVLQDLKMHNQKLSKLVNQQFYKINNERKNLVYALAKLAEARDNKSAAHLYNVSKNVRTIAMSLQFTPKYEKIITSDFIDTIAEAAALHDIGKVLIPDRILLKKGILTEEERNVMMTHAEIGAKTLMEIDSQTENNAFIKMAIDIAYYHHEAFDGSGYPLGLAGTDIPLAARIMAVVDAYDALLCKRCYKQELTKEKAIEIIKQNSGNQFDPDIVEITKKVQRMLSPNQYEKRRNKEETGPFHTLLKRLDIQYLEEEYPEKQAYLDVRR